MRFGIYLMRQGVISAEQLVEALEEQLNDQPPLGQIAIEEGALSVRQVFSVLRAQSSTANNRFGDAAIELGLLNRQEVAALLMLQADRVRPLDQLLLTHGAIDGETLEVELASYRRTLERSGTRVEAGQTGVIAAPAAELSPALTV